jgi:hypothetical protein
MMPLILINPTGTPLYHTSISFCSMLVASSHVLMLSTMTFGCYNCRMTLVNWLVPITFIFWPCWLFGLIVGMVFLICRDIVKCECQSCNGCGSGQTCPNRDCDCDGCFSCCRRQPNRYQRSVNVHFDDRDQPGRLPDAF